MACGSVLAGLSLIGLSRVHQLWEWTVLWGGGLGIARAMTLYPVAFTVVANWFYRQRGQAMALLTVLGGLASPIYVPLAGWLVPRVGWRETLILFGLTQLDIALPLALLAVRRHPEDKGHFPDGALRRRWHPLRRCPASRCGQRCASCRSGLSHSPTVWASWERPCSLPTR